MLNIQALLKKIPALPVGHIAEAEGFVVRRISCRFLAKSQRHAHLVSRTTSPHQWS